MNFYEFNLHYLCYIFICLGSVFCSYNPDLNIVGFGLKEISPCSIGLQFFVNANNTSNSVDYIAELVPDQCCLIKDSDNDDNDCKVVEIVGDCHSIIPKGKTITLELVAPIIDPYERHGYCNAYLDSKKTHEKHNVLRNNVKIPFDTRIRKLNDTEKIGVKFCKNVDEDPTNECKPVDCDSFYNGLKPHYDKRKKRCVEVPECFNDNTDLPNKVYDPVTNTCVDEDPITVDDVDFIKKLTHSSGRVAKDVVIIKKFHDEITNGTEDNMINVDDIANDFKKLEQVSDKKNKICKEKIVSEKTLINNVKKFFSKSKYGLPLLGLIIVVQCGLIGTMMYCLTKNCLCKKKPDVEHTFFNYRQDASVTTPLIGTSNIETETTCQFMSDSTNVDKKIQCYKACQKDTAKVSLSDDILSKCLNRRSWDRKQVKSDANDLENIKECKKECSNAKFETRFVSTKNQNQKVNFETEKAKENKTKSKHTLRKSDSKFDTFKETVESDFSSSEQEIKCHSYNNNKFTDSKEMGGVSVIGMSEKEIKVHSYNFLNDAFDVDRSCGDFHKKMTYDKNETTNDMKSIQQVSAQASFSNDSIDDFLSERGILFLRDENKSKCSLSNESILKSSTSNSSKTSKNNILKNLLSHLKRNKQSPSSEPGAKNSKGRLNLELIHMSRGTMYSSSNNESECLKNFTRPKDSRTSL